MDGSNAIENVSKAEAVKQQSRQLRGNLARDLAVTSVPFAHLYETGHRTVWAPAVLHTAIDAFKLFAVPAAAATTLSLLLVAVSLVVPLLALTVAHSPTDKDSG